MAKYIKYDLENLEEIKITPTINQSDANFSKSYISGSSVKGACIEKYIIENKIKNLNEGISKELFLKGGLKFLNAYPLDTSEKERSLPFPSCYYALKDDIKQQKDKLKITNSLDMEKGKNYAKVKGKEFVLFQSEEDLKNISVLKEEYLHIRKPGEKNDENKIFRYEVIKANQKFRGYIKVEDKFEEYIDDIKNLLNNTFYIGGSKGSGYGLCKIDNIKVLNENPEYKYFEKVMDLDEEYFEDEEKIYIYALSDIIYRNKLGQYKTIFDEDFVAKNIGVDKVEVNKECYVDTEYCTSFNNKWGYRQPIISAIKAGSIISYDIKEGEIDLDNVKEFIDSGIGERKNDGYGRFIILNSLSGEIVTKYKKKEEKLELEKLDKDKNKQMELILNRIYNSKLESKLPNKVLNIKEELTRDKEIKTNQWGKLYRLMNILLETDRKEGIKKAEDYFDHINSKQRNRDLANALRRIEVDGKELKDFIISYLKMSVDEFKRSNEYEISLGDVHSSLTEEEIYRYNVRTLKELFRLNLRKSKKGEK